MVWVTSASLALSIALAAPGIQSDNRLNGQRLEGTRRICVYGTGDDARVKRIGRGEPCPQRYREERPEPEWVPSLAMRVGEGRLRGRAVCLYRYAGFTYQTARPASMRCPLTPSASMQVLPSTREDRRQ